MSHCPQAGFSADQGIRDVSAGSEVSADQPARMAASTSARVHGVVVMLPSLPDPTDNARDNAPTDEGRHPPYAETTIIARGHPP
ncbi:hypothetical protein OG239_21220 [Streptomyces sp. NBC_00868]|uniref:hypothetical protein n=1 Tax=unclassified Streptomyces TaxID=2593676 RepID=UPI003247374D|nr:hypothetical protein OG239_21220 [Streptomyces sp. NBC_00868]